MQTKIQMRLHQASPACSSVSFCLSACIVSILIHFNPLPAAQMSFHDSIGHLIKGTKINNKIETDLTLLWGSLNGPFRTFLSFLHLSPKL